MGTKRSGMTLISDTGLDYDLDTSGEFEFYDGGPTVLIDGDPVAYKSAAKCDITTHTIYLNEEIAKEIEGGITDVYNEYSVKDYREWNALLRRNPSLSISKKVECDYDDKSMFHTIKSQLKRIIRDTKAGSMKIYLTDGSVNFRVTDNLATVKKYKGNRSSDSKPLRLSEARNYMVKEFGAVMADKMEADDALSIDHWKSWNNAMRSAKRVKNSPFTEGEIAMSMSKTVLATIDKDIKMVPGKFINPDQDIGIEEIYPLGSLHLTDKRELKFSGLRGFYAQILSGDTTDNIPGVYFCGSVKVYETLKDCNNEEELFKATLSEIYEGFHREHIKSLDGLIIDKVEERISAGERDTKSNRAKIKSSIKKDYMGDISYGDKYYYPWWCYEENDDGTVSRTLKKDVTSEDIEYLSPFEYMAEVSSLVHMLKIPPQDDQSHLKNFPIKWVGDVDGKFIKKNIKRYEHKWVL